MILAEFVYILCTITSLLVTIILCRNFLKTGERFLLWSTLCFLGLTINNAMLFVDVVIFPNSDLAVLRTLPAVLGLGSLIYGFIWDVA